MNQNAKSLSFISFALQTCCCQVQVQVQAEEGGAFLPSVRLPLHSECGALAERRGVMADTKDTQTFPPPRTPSLSVMTFNVWFDDMAYVIRLAALARLILASPADVVCLQEVTPRFARLLCGDPALRAAGYVASDADGAGATVQPYGVLILCKRGLAPSFSFHDLPTSMARRLLVATLHTARGPFVVATVHLESLDNQPRRAAQLAMARQVLSRATAAIGGGGGSGGCPSVLCGDFNFCSYRNYNPEPAVSIGRLLESDSIPRRALENDVLPRLLPQHVDVWPLLRCAKGGEDRGYTFDSEVNENLVVNKQREQMRYDRIMFSPGGAHDSGDSGSDAKGGGPAAAWVPLSIELVGNTPIDTSAKSPPTTITTVLGASAAFAASASSLRATDDTVEGGSVVTNSMPARQRPLDLNLAAVQNDFETEWQGRHRLFISDHFGLVAHFGQSIDDISDDAPVASDLEDHLRAAAVRAVGSSNDNDERERERERERIWE